MLVDEVAQQIFVRRGDLLERACAVLASLLVHFRQGAVIVRARDDLVVHPGDDVLDRGAAIGALGRDVTLGMDPGGTGKQRRA